ncbi:kinase-like protein [Schizopora paradoxa]|uniref:mitogen-activated protein kinase kinase kinase n=1 Tax=Schizopora paradoxa TaxID=27342 RepID=A0A0H2REC4_9AGAM|nr:kinase-like protein [Schizopora paradoxa]
MEQLKDILAGLSHLDLGDQIVNKQVHASRYGSSCDVYSAWSNKHNKKVAVKQIRVFMIKDQVFAKRLAREIRIWAALDDKNVLPFFGYTLEGQNMTPSFVSEWMEHGNLHDFMKSFPRGSIETCTMLIGIASGLSHLHSKGIIHADLKSHNVLISADKSPLLADFGLSLMLNHSQTSPGTSNSTRGTLRWMARELFLSPNDESPRYNVMSDIWSLGMVTYELLSWDVPFFRAKADAYVLFAIIGGQLPERPETSEDSRVFDQLWEFCELCWADFGSRPSARESMAILSSIEREARKEPGESNASSEISTSLRNRRSRTNLCHPFESDNSRALVRVSQVALLPQPSYSAHEEVHLQRGNSITASPNSSFVLANSAHRKQPLRTDNTNLPTFSEVLKGFKASIEDPVWKILPYALKKYASKVNDKEWRNYAIIIRYDSKERCLSYDDKLLLLFQMLKNAKKNPDVYLMHIDSIQTPFELVTRTPRGRSLSKQSRKELEDRTDSMVAALASGVSYAVAISPRLGEEEDELDVAIDDAFIILSREKLWRFVQRDLTGDVAVNPDTGERGWVPSFCLLETNIPVAVAIEAAKVARCSASGSPPPSSSPAARGPILPLNILSTSLPGVALMDYKKRGDDELDLVRNDFLRVYRQYNHWSYAVKESGGDRGWVPSWFIAKVRCVDQVSPTLPVSTADSVSTSNS